MRPVFGSRATEIVYRYVLRVRMRLMRSSCIADALVEPMYTRLMFVPPEFATRSVSGLFEMTMPHGSDPTATGAVAKPLLEPELCQMLSWLKFVFERKTLPRPASTAMSPIVPCCGSEYVRP